MNSVPLLPSDPPARAIACSIVSHVRTPNGIAIGYVVERSTMPRATAWASTSKCGVSPRMRHPSGTIAS